MDVKQNHGPGSPLNHLVAGITVSALGSQMTALVLPLMAVTVLTASTQQMALLQAAGTAPYLLFGLVVGHWLEGRSLHQVMVLADIVRAILMAAVAATVALGRGNIHIVIVVAFVSAVFSLLFDSAYYSFVPRLVKQEDTLLANSRLETGRQLASVTGSAIAGAILQWIGPPLALCIDGATYLLSAMSLSRIPADDVLPRTEKVRLRDSLERGFSIVLASRLLIAFTVLGGAWSFFVAAFYALYLLYLSRSLMLTATWIAVIFACRSAGTVLGAWAAPRITSKIRIGSGISSGLLIGSCASLVVGLVTGQLRAPILAACAFIEGLATSQAIITQLTVRQRAVPRGSLIPVNTTVRFVYWGVLPLGALVGGAVADRLGLRQGIILAATGLVVTAVSYFPSPVGRLAEFPRVSEPAQEN